MRGGGGGGVAGPGGPRNRLPLPAAHCRLFEDQHNTAVVQASDEFQVRAVESLLIHYSSVLDYQLHLLAEATEHVLEHMMASASNQTLVQRLLPLKSRLAEFEVQIKEYRQALQDVLLDDHDVQQMRAMGGRTHPGMQYHFENMVEGMSQAAEVMGNQTQELLRTVAGSEKVLEITLDAARNRLMRLNLFVTTGAFVVGTGALGASLLGARRGGGQTDSPGRGRSAVAQGDSRVAAA